MADKKGTPRQEAIVQQNQNTLHKPWVRLRRDDGEKHLEGEKKENKDRKCHHVSRLSLCKKSE